MTVRKVKVARDARRSRTRSGAGAVRELGEGTRERLLQVARQLFADRGYHHVTVRDISQEAGANLAAVGYHFGDKLSLYRTIVESEIAVIRGKLTEVVTVAANLSPEEKLRSYVHHYLPRMLKPEGSVEWAQRLFRHEMAEPTPIAQDIADKVFRPRMRYLAELVAEALACDPTDRRVQLCAFSIQAQCMFYVRDSFRNLVFPNLPPQTLEEIGAVADHITDFSLAGIRALRGKPGPRRGPASKSRSRVED